MPEQPIAAQDLEFVLQQTYPMWEQMRGCRIFITGGTGFFGAWLLSSLLYANRALDLRAQAMILTRNSAAFAARIPHLATDPSITLLQGDIRSFEMPSGEFDFVIHAATDVAAPAAPASPLDVYTAIADGSARVLEFAASHATRKFLLTSSGAVYGKQPASLIHTPEDYSGAPDVLDPASAYGEGKRASELMCSLYANRTSIDFKIARCFAFAGPYLPLGANFAIGNFIRDVINGGPIKVAGDGTAVRSYLYGADLAVWLWTILFNGPSMDAFNVGSEEAISIGDLARLTVAALDPNIAIEFAKQTAQGKPAARYVPSTQRAQQRLNLRETVTLAESIRRTAAWHGFVARTSATKVL